MKKIYYILILLGIITFGFNQENVFGDTIGTVSPVIISGNVIKPRDSTKGFQVPSLSTSTTPNCVSVNASGTFSTVGCTSSSASASGTPGNIQFAGSAGVFNANGLFTWDNTNGRLGIGTSSPSYDLGFGGSTSRTVGVERSISSTGSALTVLAGGAVLGGSDKPGGELSLYSGVSTGYAKSDIKFYTSPRITDGALASITLDTASSDGGWAVNDTATDDDFSGTTTIRVDAINGSGQPTAVTITVPGSGHFVNESLYFNDAGYGKFIYTTANTITGTGDNTQVNTFAVHGDYSTEVNPVFGNGTTGDSALIVNDFTTGFFFRGYSSFHPLITTSISSDGVFTGRNLTLDSGEGGFSTNLNVVANTSGGGSSGGINVIYSTTNIATLGQIDKNGNFNSISNVSTPQGGFGIYQNLAKFSEQFDSYVWTKTNTTVVANSITAPNGTVTMDKITSTGSNSTLRQSIVAPSTGTMTISAYVYAPSSVSATIGGNGLGGNSFSAGVQVQRVSFSFSATSGSSYDAGFQSYTGEFYAWGFQAEMYSTFGPYIRTDNNALTTSTNGLVLGSLNNVFFGNNGFGVMQPAYAVDLYGTLNGSIIPAPAAPSMGAFTSGGSATTGSHSCKLTFYNAYGESTPSAKSNVRSASASNKTSTVSIAIGPTGTVGRKLYCTVNGDTGNSKLASTVTDNTSTTTIFNIADGSLGADAPSTNTTGTLTVATGGTTAMFIDSSQHIGIGTTTPAANLHITGTAPTLRLGEATTNKTGCFEMFDSVNTTTLMYIYPASGMLTATSTKPAFCK